MGCWDISPPRHAMTNCRGGEGRLRDEAEECLSTSTYQFSVKCLIIP